MADILLRPVPDHVAIIMDGNGRWATARGLPRVAGHREGAKAVRRTIEAAISHGVRYLTLFAFSSENWQRPPGEVADLKFPFLSNEPDHDGDQVCGSEEGSFPAPDNDDLRFGGAGGLIQVVCRDGSVATAQDATTTVPVTARVHAISRAGKAPPRQPPSS